jgi:hypothetical protein
MDDYVKGVLEGLGYCLTLSRKDKHGKASRIIRERIIETAASDLEFRMTATA